MSAPAPVSVSNLSPGKPTPEEVLGELETLLASRHLRESHQLPCFLEFVVHETLAGRQDGLKEYLLGCKVFGRRQDYDPRADGIVRVQATTLRKRLEKHYAEEGASAKGKGKSAVDVPGETVIMRAYTFSNYAGRFLYVEARNDLHTDTTGPTMSFTYTTPAGTSAAVDLSNSSITPDGNDAGARDVAGGSDDGFHVRSVGPAGPGGRGGSVVA